MKKILVVDENKKSNENIIEALKVTSYKVESSHDVLEGIEAITAGDYSLLILHTEFHSELLERLIKLARKLTPNIRILVIATPFYKEVHLEDLVSDIDQVISPDTDARTLVRFVHALFVNHEAVTHDDSRLTSEREGIVMDLKTRLVTKDGIEYILTPIEFGLLENFLKHKNQLLTREDILETIWPFSDNENTIRKVDVHIKNLRTKMGIFSIASVRGKGYQWAE